jgi:hypothetical protein
MVTRTIRLICDGKASTLKSSIAVLRSNRFAGEIKCKVKISGRIALAKMLEYGGPAPVGECIAGGGFGEPKHPLIVTPAVKIVEVSDFTM